VTPRNVFNRAPDAAPRANIARHVTDMSGMEIPHPDSSLAALIDELKNRDGVEGSLGESPASLLAYVEQLEQRIAHLEGERASET
jgi:hypothetical protein